MKATIDQAVKILREGGLILYPTDTIWGIGCDATDAQAVAKIIELKQRPDLKSLIVLVDTVGRIASYVTDVPDIAYDLVELTDKPLTIIYPEAKNLAKNVIATDGSIGIRVVQHDFCQHLIARFGKPIVSTSANISGEPFPKFFADIDARIKNGVDLIVPEQFDNPKSNSPSSIISLGKGGEVKVIRE